MIQKLLLTILLTATLAWAAEPPQSAPATSAGAHGTSHTEQAIDTLPHPAVSADGWWAGAVVIAVLGIFLAAAVIGPIVRANMPPEAPPQSHDDAHATADPHASDHGHGGH
jgi:hypothetical protein